MNPKKSESANLENKRSIFWQTGMIIALCLVLAAFNWKTYDKMIVQTYQRTGENIPEEMVQITEQKRPEPPRMERPRVVLNINIVDDDAPVDENVMVDAEIDPMDTVPLYLPMPEFQDEENASENEIFTVVESMPEFPGGDKAVYAYLEQNMVYPEQAKAVGISGMVYVSFVVEKDGSITDVQLLRGIGGGCDEEALRVVKDMPRWIPGKQRHVPVRVNFHLGIKFTLFQM
jgi:periplasmic protein TonB